MNHLSYTVYYGLNSINTINRRKALPPAEPVGNSNSYLSQSREEPKHFFHGEKPLVPFFTIVLMKFTLQF